jgi:hypothetical protein
VYDGKLDEAGSAKEVWPYDVAGCKTLRSLDIIEQFWFKYATTFAMGVDSIIVDLHFDEAVTVQYSRRFEVDLLARAEDLRMASVRVLEDQ